MEHQILESTLSPDESIFLDLMRQGDDFFKIELLRPAKSYYKKALDLNIEIEVVSRKIAECDRLLAYEIKVIRILVAVAAVLALGYLIWK